MRRKLLYLTFMWLGFENGYRYFYKTYETKIGAAEKII